MYPTNPSNVIGQNDPALAYTSTPIMGNTNFTIMAPPTKGEVAPSYPQIPYQSLESELFFLSMSNPMSAPYTIYGGSNTGQQVVSGQVTMEDPTGTSRYQMGFQSISG